MALPGRGSGLVAGAQTANLTREEVVRLVLDGFFPISDVRARPFRSQGGLQEWGLPYAADSAVTHHLADFLRDRPRVDAVLFNGGSLHAAVLRERLLDQVAAWQDGARPLELENAEPDLAVARGAARFGKLLLGQSRRIAAGAARAVFLQAQTARNEAPALVCVLPRNAAAEQVFDIDLPGLEVRTDRPVSFQAWSSTRHGRCKAGDVLPAEVEALHRLPPLETIIRTADGQGDEDRTVPVRLAAKTNALGLLQISCVSTDLSVQRSWPLEFNLRPQEHNAAGAPSEAPRVEPNATAEARQAAHERIASTFGKPAPKSEKLTANAVLKHLERSFGLPRHEWNAALLRDLWPALHAHTAGRKLSVEHEEAWLTLAGFLLRPGFGFAGDAPAHGRTVATARRGTVLSRQAQQGAGGHPVAPRGGRTDGRTAAGAAGRRAERDPRRARLARADPAGRIAGTPAAADQGRADRDLHQTGTAADRGEAALCTASRRSRPAAEPHPVPCRAGDAWFRRNWWHVPTRRSRTSIGPKRSCWNCTHCSCGRRAWPATAAWMSRSRCATRSPPSWKGPVSHPHGPAASKPSPPSDVTERSTLYGESLPPGLVLDAAAGG